MHVVLIVPRFYPFWGGTEIRIKRVAEALSARGIRFTVLTRRLKRTLPAAETIGPLSVVRLPAPLILFSFFVRRWLTRHHGEIDLIHSFRLDKCALPAAGPAQRFAIPHIADIITNEVDKMLAKASGRRNLRRTDTGTDLFHCLSAETAETLTAFGIAPQKLWQRGNAVDTETFIPQDGPAEKVPVTVLCCGRLERQKGTDILIEAWRRLSPAVSTKARLVLAGSGKWEERIRRAAADMTNVEFLGTVPRAKMATLYREADIYVQASRFEGMSNALLEAAASGLPLVSTDIGANRAVIENGVNGYAVPCENPDALAVALGHLIDDASLRKQFGAASRQLAETRFSFSALFDDYETVYRAHAARALHRKVGTGFRV